VACIAVIDDNVLVRQLVGEVLADEGYQVLELDGQDGVFGQIKAQRPDLVMLDLHLGAQGSGWELLASIRADPSLSQIPVIIVTAGPEELARHASEMEHMGYRTLEKPFDLDEMFATVRQMLAAAENGPAHSTGNSA
jgi:two-component system nitrogen regulation response regulator NtrX